jgi:polyhydroxyalkanoate synthesis regulator phasin
VQQRILFQPLTRFHFSPQPVSFTMEDLFKKFVNAGVGYIAQGSKSVQSTIEKLVKDNKMTQAEGKKIVDELMKSGETKRVELEKQFQGLADRVKSTVGLGETKAKSKPAAKKPVAKSAAKPASSATSKTAGAVKKTADKVSSAAGSAQKSAAATAGAAKKPAAKKPAAAASAPAANAADNA